MEYVLGALVYNQRNVKLIEELGTSWQTLEFLPNIFFYLCIVSLIYLESDYHIIYYHSIVSKVVTHLIKLNTALDSHTFY